MTDKEEKFNPEQGNNCNNCGYCETYCTGTAHKRCQRNFTLSPFRGKITDKKTGKQKVMNVYLDQTVQELIKKKELKDQVACLIVPNQWTKMFPLDYAPIWIYACLGWSKTVDPRFVEERSALEEMVTILGSVGRI